MTHEQLKALIEVEETTSLWGSEHKITPLLVTEVFGDGRALFAIIPLNTRPNYYVVRGDSSGKGMSTNETADWIEKIRDAIEEDYSEISREREFLIENGVAEEDADLANYPNEMGWPVLNGDAGVSWSEIDWPVLAELEQAEANGEATPNA
jgi:hypothetical protein